MLNYWLLKQVIYKVHSQIIIILTLSVILLFKVRRLGHKNNAKLPFFFQQTTISSECLRKLPKSASLRDAQNKLQFVSVRTHVKLTALSSGSISGVLQTLTVAKPTKKWSVYYRVHRTSPIAPPWAGWTQCTHIHITYLRLILILSSHLCPGLPSNLFPSGFPNNMYIFLISPIRATWPAHIAFLHFITVVTFGADCNLWTQPSSSFGFCKQVLYFRSYMHISQLCLQSVSATHLLTKCSGSQSVRLSVIL
jgi:hypothetical protein